MNFYNESLFLTYAKPTGYVSGQSALLQVVIPECSLRFAPLFLTDNL